MPRREEDDVELDLYVYNISDYAYLVGETMDEPDGDKDKYWLPKSQVNNMSEVRADGSRTFLVRHWWAHKNGLI